jgi:hypothetical protein
MHLVYRVMIGMSCDKFNTCTNSQHFHGHIIKAYLNIITLSRSAVTTRKWLIPNCYIFLYLQKCIIGIKIISETSLFV